MEKQITGKQIELIKELKPGEYIFMQLSSNLIHVYQKRCLEGIKYTTEECLVILDKNGNIPKVEKVTKVTRL